MGKAYLCTKSAVMGYYYDCRIILSPPTQRFTQSLDTTAGNAQ